MDLPGRLILFLDASTPLAQAGIWRDGAWLARAGFRGGAEQSLFLAVDESLTGAGVTVDKIDAFGFCEGPGSMLGIRICAMAIRGWQSLLDTPRPVFSYLSLELAGKIILQKEPLSRFTVISDARRGFWNVLRFSADSPPAEMERLPSDELTSLPAPVFRLEEPRQTPCPVETKTISADFSAFPSVFQDPALLRENSKAEPYAPAPAEFKKWTAQRHR